MPDLLLFGGGQRLTNNWQHGWWGGDCVMDFAKFGERLTNIDVVILSTSSCVAIPRSLMFLWIASLQIGSRVAEVSEKVGKVPWSNAEQGSIIYCTNLIEDLETRIVLLTNLVATRCGSLTDFTRLGEGLQNCGNILQHLKKLTQFHGCSINTLVEDSFEIWWTFDEVWWCDYQTLAKDWQNAMKTSRDLTTRLPTMANLHVPWPTFSNLFIQLRAIFNKTWNWKPNIANASWNLPTAAILHGPMQAKPRQFSTAPCWTLYNSLWILANPSQSWSTLQSIALLEIHEIMKLHTRLATQLDAGGNPDHGHKHIPNQWKYINPLLFPCISRSYWITYYFLENTTCL